MNMKRLRLILVGLFAALVMAFAPVLATASPQTVVVPTVISPFREVHNMGASSATMTICKDIGTNWLGQRYCKSGLGTLKPGEGSRTKYGWNSTEGLRVAPGCTASALDPPQLMSRLFNSTGKWYATKSFTKWHILYTC